MPFLSGLMTLVLALAISVVAAYFSVTGLAALFAAAYGPVIVMGGCLEAGKLVAAAWLHANWHNPRVSRLHKAYLSIAVAALMVVTAIGIFGYLSAGYLEQTAPLGEVSIQIEQREGQIAAKRAEVQRLTDRQAQLDAAVNSLIAQQRVIPSQKLRDSQKAERAQVASDLAAANATIDRLAGEIVPLKSKSSAVGAKLGPIKYVAALFGWTDADSAVRLVILLLMIAFDPLAVMLVLSSVISFQQWAEIRRQAGPMSQDEAHGGAEVPVDPEPSHALKTRRPSGMLDFPAYYAAEATHSRYASDPAAWHGSTVTTTHVIPQQPAPTPPLPAAPPPPAPAAEPPVATPPAPPPEPVKPVAEMTQQEKLDAANRALPSKSWLDM